MNKLLPNVLRQLCAVAASGIVGLLISVNAFAQCYTLRLGSNGKYLTNDHGPLRMRPANNQRDQIFKFEQVNGGQHWRIIPMGGANQGRTVLTRNSNNAVLSYDAYTEKDSQLWVKKFIVDSDPGQSFGFVMKNSNMGFGSTYNWGDGDPNAVSDINMVPESELDIFGANKWFMDQVPCPATEGNCEMGMSVSANISIPKVNTQFQMTQVCYGFGCSSGVSYEWLLEGVSTGVWGGSPIFTAPSVPGVLNYTVIATKEGCTTRFAHTRIYVQPDPNGRTGISEGPEENLNRELQVFPNPANSEFEVEFYLAKGEPADIILKSVTGEEVQKRSIVGKGIHHEKFDIRGRVAGIYLFNVVKKDSVEVKKVFVHK